MLDPRVKFNWCNGEEQIIIKNFLPAKVVSSIKEMLQTLFLHGDHVVPIDTASHELPVYLSRLGSGEDADPLWFWKEN